MGIPLLPYYVRYLRRHQKENMEDLEHRIKFVNFLSSYVLILLNEEEKLINFNDGGCVFVDCSLWDVCSWLIRMRMSFCRLCCKFFSLLIFGELNRMSFLVCRFEKKKKKISWYCGEICPIRQRERQKLNFFGVRVGKNWAYICTYIDKNCNKLAGKCEGRK